MEDLGFREMQEIQRELQEKYKDQWKPVAPETGKDKLLWLMIELGEAADIIKKDGNRRIMEDRATRKPFTEELCDVLMYFNDVMLCYGLSVEELREAYLKKHQRNLKRW